MSDRDPIRASVVVATYNRRDMLAGCLASLAGQAFEGGYEVVVVDDGSSDGTGEMVKGLTPGYPVPLVYFRQENRGVAAARNAGLARARGAVIAFLDDDHVATGTWLRDLCRALEDPGVGGVGGRNRSVPAPALISRYLCFHRAHEAPQVERGEVLYLGTGNSAFRREAVARAGPFDERFASFFKGVAPGGEDTEFSVRIRRAGYRLAYDPSAVTDHYQKASFRAVMKERFNFGVNRVLWYRMEGRRLSPLAVAGHILWMAVSLVKWPAHAWRYRQQGLGLRESAAFPAIDKASEVVYHAGSLYGMIKIKTLVP
jgi:GT2 family glycosyltransferase